LLKQHLSVEMQAAPEVVLNNILQAGWGLLQQLQHRPAQCVQPQLSIVPETRQHMQCNTAQQHISPTDNHWQLAGDSVFSRSSALYLWEGST
jgi:hypothetical protein